jgi:DNA-binding PadR family transcriptional regulator
MPLTPAAFHILLSLAGGDRHGLGIADDVADVTGGALRLGPGTLYRSLKELTLAGFVRDVRAADKEDDPRRKYYRITASGRAAVAAEAARYDRISSIARKRRLLPEGRS